jgi:sulfate/thiosulfate transport system permease protein
MSDLRLPADGVAEPRWLRWTLTAVTVVFMAVFLLLPLVNIFHSALSEGWRVFLASLQDENAAAAIRLSLLSTLCAVLLSGVFGLAAAWLLGRHRIPGHGLWVAVLDLPFAISPVVAGLMFVLLCGLDGWFGPWLDRHGTQIIFAKPGIILATAFVTFPFVARELLPLVQALGPESEEAAQLLGASPLQTFWRVTLPALKWGLLYGVILCASRAMGEFGAVSVVSGHIRGETMTLPLHIEATYNEYQFGAAFACATLLSLMALVSLALKSFVAWRARRDRESA